MSGSSKRTLRMPRPFQPSSTCSTETDFFSAIAMASAPAPVVPGFDLQPQLARHRRNRVRTVRRENREDAALPAVAPQQRRGYVARRLKVVAVEAQRRIGVVDDDERTPRTTNEHRQ